jgi:hypothetical protein
MRSMFAILIGIAGLLGSRDSSAQLARASVEERVLTNGIRLVCVRFPGSTNVSIFSYLPLGLAKDAAGQAQWSHLMEHLVIRSTMGESLAEGNAETLPDHMRLDFYGTTRNWREGVSHHRRWLEGAAFTEESLRAGEAESEPGVRFHCAEFRDAQVCGGSVEPGLAPWSDKCGVKGGCGAGDFG